MWGWAQWRASSPPQPPSPPFVTNEPRAVSVRLLRKVAYFKRMTKAAEEKASMLEPTDEMWGKATAEEQRLFLVGLAKELRRANGAVSQSQRQKEKEGRNRAEERRKAMEQEHCVADYLA